MADLEEVFKILADDTTGAGEAPISRIEGEAAAGKEGLIGFSFKDSSGDVVLVQLTSEGKVPVDTEAVPGTCISGYATNAGSTSDVDIVTLTGALTKTYNNFEAIGACLRATQLQIVYVDDAGGGGESETVLAEWLVGPGQFSFKFDMRCLQQSTSGGTATQEFRLRAKNLFKASTIRANFAMLET